MPTPHDPPLDSTLAVDLTTDPATFLRDAADLLAADPVVTSVVATVTQRAADDDARGSARPEHPRWWATVRDAAGRLVGAAMRTAPFAPHPVYALPMPDEAARELARVLHARAERVGGVNGALPAARVVAEETARLTGGAVEVDEQLTLWEMGDLVPQDAPGRLRRATEADVPRCTAWFNAFGREAAEQAGRDGEHAGEQTTEAEMRRRVLEDRRVWVWEAPDGEVVHVTAHSLPAYGVSRVGPVFTPREHRGHGYASAGVAQVTERLLAAGSRACLFTDQANPTSNKIYAAIGYRPVVETANLLVTTPARP